MRGSGAPGRWRALPLACLLLAGCATAPRQSAPQPERTPPPTVLPRNPPDINQVPDAVPVDEPRSAHGNPPFYDVAGHRYVVLANSAGYVERGVASWYGTEFHGLRTSTGEPYDMFAMTAAHKTLPLPCYARVTNLGNGRSVVVRINDRGPFVANRIIDLSYSAAARLDMLRNGTAFVQVEVLTPGAPVISASLPVTTSVASAAAAGVSNVPPVMPASPAAAAPATTSASAASAAAAPIAATPESPAGAVPVAGARFYIQVGAYAQADNARRAVQKLRAAGFENALILPPDSRQPLQRVRLGPVQSVQQFDALIARLGALGFGNARLAQD